MRATVLMTVYAWDDFIARQYARLEANLAATDLDLWVLADETRGPIAGLPTANVIRTSQDDIRHKYNLPLILPAGWTHKNPLWWNVDCLTYRFFAEHPEYDYCVVLDYDARINLDIKRLVADVAAKNLDLVALPVADDLRDWYWRAPHAPLYRFEELRAYLICVMVISGRAAQYLTRRRREQAADYAAGRLTFWPFCEPFMPIELERAGFKTGTIAAFGDVRHLGWEEVWCEGDAKAEQPGFVHPVMDRNRFLAAFTNRYHPLSDIFRPRSRLYRELGRFPLTVSARHLARLLATRLFEKVRHMTKAVKGA